MSTTEENLCDELVDGASLNQSNHSAFVPIAKTKRKNYVKKVEHDWSHEEIMRLIVAVEERRVLWDFSLPEYKLPKAGAWKEVVDAVGNTTVDDAKGKWANLRVTFKNNIAKYRSKKSGQSTEESVVIQWKYFKSMMFLEANGVQQSTESTSSFALASANTDASALNHLSDAPSPPSDDKPGKRKRRSTAGLTTSPSPTPSNNSIREVAFNALNSQSKFEDKFSAYGEYIASELRALPPDQVSFVQRGLTRELLRLLEAAENAATPPVDCSPIEYADIYLLPEDVIQRIAKH